MPNAGDLKPDSQFRGLFIGRSGTGKKAAACSFPGPIKYFDFDQRIGGLLGCPWIDRTQIDYTTYNPKMPDFMPLLNKELEQLIDQDRKGTEQYRMAVFASITGFTSSLQRISLPLTHSKTNQKGTQSGKFIGEQAIVGPDDYMFEKVVTTGILAAVRELKNTSFVMTAHQVDKYGKADPNNPYSESTIVGEKLAITEKLGEASLIYFNEIYGFRKANKGNAVEHIVKFRSDLYRTTFSKIDTNEVDITGKNFYNMLKVKM